MSQSGPCLTPLTQSRNLQKTWLPCLHVIRGFGACLWLLFITTICSKCTFLYNNSTFLLTVTLWKQAVEILLTFIRTECDYHIFPWLCPYWGYVIQLEEKRSLPGPDGFWQHRIPACMLLCRLHAVCFISFPTSFKCFTLCSLLGTQSALRCFAGSQVPLAIPWLGVSTSASLMALRWHWETDRICYVRVWSKNLEHHLPSWVPFENRFLKKLWASSELRSLLVLCRWGNKTMHDYSDDKEKLLF